MSRDNRYFKIFKKKYFQKRVLFLKLKKALKMEAKRLENSKDYLLNIKGLYSFAVEQVQATIKQGEKYHIAGVFNLVHLSPKKAKVKIIPTYETIKHVDLQTIKNIYSKVGVTLEIEKGEVFDIYKYLQNNVLETKDAFGDLTGYSKAQQDIIYEFRDTQGVGSETYYIFLTDAKSSTSQGGYMPLGGQFGFVFDNSERTIATELAHGIFKLKHPFKKKNQAGKTTSIMDYGSGEEFLFSEWKQIGDPALKIGIFQG